MNNAVSSGKVLAFTNGGSAIASGDVVVIGQTLGVATEAIANGETKSVAIEGVFTCPKVSGAVIAQGESLSWDVSAVGFDDNLASPASGDVTGPTAIAAEAAGSGVTSIAVKFTGVPGTVH